MRYEVKTIGVWPFIKVSFFFNLIIGFLFGLFYALFIGVFMSFMSRLSNLQPGMFEEFGMMEPLPIGVMLVVLPITCAILGAIFYTLIGVVLVVIYNLIAKIVGGYELELELAPVSPPPPGAPLTGYTAAAPPPGPTPQPSSPPQPPQAPPQEPTDRGSEQRNDERPGS
jgi:hypothetical protein